MHGEQSVTQYNYFKYPQSQHAIVNKNKFNDFNILFTIKQKLNLCIYITHIATVKPSQDSRFSHCSVNSDDQRPKRVVATGQKQPASKGLLLERTRK